MNGAAKPLTVLALVVAVTVTGGSPGQARAAAAKRRTLDVVASFYPLAEAAQRVGRGRVQVENLTPPGVEPHDFEASTDDIDAIEDADLVVVMGEDFQPSLERAARRRDGTTLVVLDTIPGRLREGDPHVWLDPRRMIAIVDATAGALARVDRGNAAQYRDNAAMYTTTLRILDEDYRRGLEDCDRHLIVTSHEAFGYLADAYGLQQEGVAGISPDAEPDPKRLGQLADLVHTKGVTTIFSEELVSPKVAHALAREAGGVRVEVLNPLEGLTAKERKAGDDYVSVMRKNLARLRTALGCR